MSSIRTNLLALSTMQHARAGNSALGTAIQRLSSGLRVNGAKDDAAGQAIGERRGVLALDLGDDVDHGLVGGSRHGEGLEPAGLRPSPHFDVKHRVRGSRSPSVGSIS